ncbi:MAG: hypothetical protein KC505_09720, partial [Myxococcales bacterium]|nr:hypothetical protein [Myxococcales bacterium]
LLTISTVFLGINLFSADSSYLDRFSDQEIAVLENAMNQQGLELNEANLDLFLKDTLSSIKDTVSSGLSTLTSGIKGFFGKTLAGLKTAADLAKAGFKSAAALAERFGVTDAIAGITTEMINAGGAAVNEAVNSAIRNKLGLKADAPIPE